MTRKVPCIECGKQAHEVGGDVLYPHRPDLYEKRFWRCECGAYVGCHPGTEHQTINGRAHVRGLESRNTKEMKLGLMNFPRRVPPCVAHVAQDGRAASHSAVRFIGPSAGAGFGAPRLAPAHPIWR